jgi:hypothetical protein
LDKPEVRSEDGAQILRLHDTYRYPKPAPKRIAEGSEEGLVSFFAATQWPRWPGLENAGRAQLEKGIDAITIVSAPDGPRRPAILIGINPHKAGSDWTPWHDEIDPRNGFVRYYGDNKPGLSENPDHTSGNRAILAQFDLSASNRSEDRRRACPLMFFESVIQENRSKGYRRFRGVGLVDRVERVVQVDRHGRPFVNYRYDCALVSLAAENNLLDWTWIAARRDASKTLAESTAFAPAAWRRWVERGPDSLDQVRQRLLSYRILSEADQRPVAGSTADSALRATLAYYENLPKSRFEAVAERVAQASFRHAGLYRLGWVSRGSGDRGIDFIGRLDLGTSEVPLRIVVAGQAKCQVGASGVADLSRLAAKLNRGWVGVFVTTGHFSLPAQRELQDDGYPILLIAGRQVGEVIARESIQAGVTVPDYLKEIDAGYEQRLGAREPADILGDE